MGDPRELARKAEAKAREQESTGDFVRIERLSKFNDGEERILRIVPPVEYLKRLLDSPEETFDDYCAKDAGPMQGWRELEMHFDLPENGALPCRRMTGEACPVCEAYEEDIQSTEPAVREAAKNLRPKQQVAFFVIERGQDEAEPYVWAIAPKWAKQIYSHCANSDYGLLYDPEKGHDIRVRRVGLKLQTYYGITPRPKPSMLYEVKGEDEKGAYVDLDFDKIQELVEKLPSISTYNNPVLDYAHYEAVLNGEMTIGEAYADQFGSDEDTEFNPDEIEESEEKKEKKPRRRRRR